VEVHCIGYKNQILLSFNDLQNWIEKFCDGNNTNDCGFDYGSNTKLDRLPDPTNALTGFRLSYPDGRQEMFNYVVDFATSNKWAFRTEEKNPAGQANRYSYALAGDVIQLNQVIDADGHATALHYYSGNTNLIREMVDPFGHTNRFGHDAGGRLTNIVDAAGLSSSVIYRNFHHILKGKSCFQPLFSRA
jgi:YD repeat-containing protein